MIDEVVPACAPWSAVVPADGTLRIVDLEGNQAVDFLLYNAHDTAERYSAPDTIAAQGNVFLTAGSVLRSNLGNPLMRIVADDVGRHDTIGGACSKESNTLRYGHHTKHQHACVENFLAEGAKWGLGKRDIVSNINWYMNVPIEEDGTLGIVDGISAPGLSLTLRAEIDTLVLVSNCPQINNPCNGFNPYTGPDDRRGLAAAACSTPSWSRTAARSAARIIRSASALGLRTIAVYSDADRGAPHVEMASAAVRLGPAPARDSYLRADAVLEAAAAHGAGAVHPGYGLLSEDAAFAEAVEEAGLRFVGPTPAQLRAFGAKDASRDLARAAGVPLLPGSGVLADLDHALAAAESIGYPVMLKATAGGGGIGMERCDVPPRFPTRSTG